MEAQRSSRAGGGPESSLDDMQAKTLEGLRDARGTVEALAREHPRMALAVALATGFVLGGGLTPRLLFSLGAIAVRNFARDYARQQLTSVTRDLFGGDTSDSGSDGDDGSRRQATATEH